MGKVLAICISEKKGTLKNEINEAKFIEDFGIENDAHAGKWHRQVSLLEFNKIDEFRKKGANVDFGAFGENLVIEGIELNTLSIGQKIKIGEMCIRDSDYSTNKVNIEHLEKLILNKNGLFKIYKGEKILFINKVENINNKTNALNLIKNIKCKSSSYINRYIYGSIFTNEYIKG